MTDQAWLAARLAAAGAVAGTVHRRRGALLHLTAAVNIPATVQRTVATIPEGKGMAGLAWRRGEPVSTCNLATDDTGDVRPGARDVAAQAAVAVPVFAGAELRAVVGFAFADQRSPDLPHLSNLAAALP